MTTLLTLKELKVSFFTHREVVQGVDGVSFQISEGEILGLVGETGCGKSTLGRTVVGLYPESARIEGTILYKGTNILKAGELALSRIRKRNIALVLQNPDLSLNPVFTVGAQLMEVLRDQNDFTAREAERHIIEILNQVGFSRADNILKKYPHQLSTGMNQRILLSCALLARPDLLIADEPVSGLDGNLKLRIKRILSRFQEKYRTAQLLITHNLELVENLANRVAVMFAGQLMEVNTTAQLIQNPRHPYTKMLLDSRRSIQSFNYSNFPGENPAGEKAGCRFFNRCPEKMTRCAEVVPRMVLRDGGEIRCHRYT